jgi:cell division septum initiation protein DivIVA
MDILHLVDRLEQLLHDSRRLPMTSSIMVDEDRIYHIIDQMRVAIPDIVKRAGRVEAERERILAQAKEEATRIRELAKQEASDLVNRDNIISSAHSRADTIIERARREAERLHEESDEYAMRVLGQLEQDLTRSLGVVRNGLNMLEYAKGSEQSVYDDGSAESEAQPIHSQSAMGRE